MVEVFFFEKKYYYGFIVQKCKKHTFFNEISFKKTLNF